MEIAATSAEVVYAVPHELDTGRAYYADLKQRTAKAGRDPNGLKIMPGITPFIGATEAEAREKYDLLNALVAPELGLSYLYAQMGDLSAHPLDGPVPEPNDPRVRSIAQNLLKLARRDNLTIRGLYTTIAAGFGSRILIGTATQIADEMQAWMEAEAADGFNICPPALPIGLEDFAASVIPELQRRGAFRTDYAGTTLREHLGVPVPASRYA
jgi:alkanesulfonate monooxygenase SsuD/methylene tetrahydromethanopterin reductase-like flavin-dependent oxidoreductase (luciferase family)